MSGRASNNKTFASSKKYESCIWYYILHWNTLQCQDRPAGKSVNIWIATLNVTAMRGRIKDIGEILAHPKVHLCCVQETIWRGESPWKSGINTVTKKLSERVTAQGKVVEGSWLERVK